MIKNNLFLSKKRTHLDVNLKTECPCTLEFRSVSYKLS